MTIVTLHAGNPGPMTGSGNATYFLPGRHPLLIDAGVGTASHLDALAAARADGPGHVVVTHAHSDHIGGSAAVAARWPATRFSKYPWPGRDERYSATTWQALADGDVLAAGDDELAVIHTPGHAPDHIALWHDGSSTAFTGDLVAAGASVVIPAKGGGSLRAYLASLERIRALRPARLLPAHGPVIDDPEAALSGYLEHRRQRERQVVDALGDGITTVAAMVDRIYTELNPALVPMAHESVLAHLIKLEDDGVAARVDDAWQLAR